MAESIATLSSLARLRGLLTGGQARKAASGGVVQVLGKAAAMLLALLLTRNLSPEDFGSFAFARSWVMLLGPVASLGFGYATFRFLPRYIAARDGGSATGYVAIALAASLGLSLLFVLGVLIAESAGVFPAPPGSGTALRIMIWAIPCLALMLVVRFANQTLGKVWLSFLPQQLASPVLQGLVFAVLIFAGMLDLASAARGFLIASWLVAALALALLLRHWRGIVGFHRPRLHLGRWLRVALTLAASSVAVIINQQADILVVGSILGAQEAGLYSIALSLALLISMASTSVAAVFAPALSRAVGSGDREAVRATTRRSAVLFLLPAAVGVLVFAVAGKAILGLFGPAYMAAFQVLMLLAVSELLIAASEPAGHLLNLGDREKANTAIVIVGAAINLALNLILVPLAGMEGAALATLVSTAFWTSARLVLVYRLFGIAAGVFALLPVAARNAR